MNNKCIKCSVPIIKELGRCNSCQTEHDRLASQLDARPKIIVEKKPTDWVMKKEIKGGIAVTTYMTREEAAMLGIRVND